MTMIALTYLSRSLLRPEQLVKELAAIQDVANTSNARNEISGKLLSWQNYFIQRLEGEEAAVDQTFERIQADTRHHYIKLLSRQAIDKRLFMDWLQMPIISDSDQLHRLTPILDYLNTLDELSLTADQAAIMMDTLASVKPRNQKMEG